MPTSKRGIKWDYYKEGETIGISEIMELVVAGRTVKDTEYRILKTCCRKEEVVSHKVVYNRKYYKTKLCKKCAEKTVSERMIKIRRSQKKEKRDPNQPYGVKFHPDWKAPFWIKTSDIRGFSTR